MLMLEFIMEYWKTGLIKQIKLEKTLDNIYYVYHE